MKQPEYPTDLNSLCSQFQKGVKMTDLPRRNLSIPGWRKLSHDWCGFLFVCWAVWKDTLIIPNPCVDLGLYIKNQAEIRGSRHGTAPQLQQEARRSSRAVSPLRLLQLHKRFIIIPCWCVCMLCVCTDDRKERCLILQDASEPRRLLQPSQWDYTHE